MTYMAQDWTGARETRFTVPDMHCAGCIAKIERLLPEQRGVRAARVNFSARSVTVVHDEDTDEPELIRAFDAIGFDAQPREDMTAAVARTDALRRAAQRKRISPFTSAPATTRRNRHAMMKAS